MRKKINILLRIVIMENYNSKINLDSKPTSEV